MKKDLYSVLDLKAKTYLDPVCYIHAGVAVREFEDTVNNPQTIMHKHPEDFSLFKIGTYDDHTAQVRHCDPELIVSALSVRSQADANNGDWFNPGGTK